MGKKIINDKTRVALIGVSLGLGLLANTTVVSASSTHTVQRGDSLSAIASRYGVSVGKLVQLNDIPNANIIRVGQVLTISNQSSNNSESEGLFANGVLPIDKSLYAVTSRFGQRQDPIGNGNKFHYGLDIASKNINRSSIYSMLPGKVSRSGYHSGYGYYVRISHQGVDTLYAHMAEQPLVKVGESVSAGKRIGIVGTTGLSTGPHLHLEVIINGKQVDPEPYVKEILNKKNVVTPSSSSSSSASKVEERVHTVRSGDTVSKIAQQYGTTIEQIKVLNKMSNANIIHVGQKIIVSRNQVSSGEGSNSNTPQNPTHTPTVQATHTVQRGDSLWLIATRNNLTVHELKDINSLTSDIIHVGQKLNLSKISSSTSQGTTSQSKKTYTIKRNDSLWKIANEHGITVKRLKELNNLQSDIIFVGDTLVVS